MAANIATIDRKSTKICSGRCLIWGEAPADVPKVNPIVSNKMSAIDAFDLSAAAKYRNIFLAIVNMTMADVHTLSKGDRIMENQMRVDAFSSLGTTST